MLPAKVAVVIPGQHWVALAFLPSPTSPSRLNAPDFAAQPIAGIPDWLHRGAESPCDKGAGRDMAETFKPGDVVKLKSGGPSMTVTGCEQGLVSVAWFENGVLRQTAHGEYVVADALQRVPAAEAARAILPSMTR